jgi:hypothetical protein
MLIPPASILATWPAPNYVDPETRGDTGRILGVVLASLVTIVLAVRFYTRRFISKSIGLDDVLIGVAYVRMIST